MARHTDINGYCDSLYRELTEIKQNLHGFVLQVERMQGEDRTVLNSHVRHLNELIQSIDWKLEIFSKECPVDWSSFGKESESTASVPSSEQGDFQAGGYVGG